MGKVTQAHFDSIGSSYIRKLVNVKVNVKCNASL